jgi:hypothetical protein
MLDEIRRWKVFDSSLIIASVCAWLFMSGIFHVQATYRHNGGGEVSSEIGTHWEELGQFKRHNYVQGGLGILLGAFGWLLLVRSSALHECRREAEVEHLKAQIARLDEMVSAIGRLIGHPALVAAMENLKNDPEYQKAERMESERWMDLQRARKEVGPED